MTIYYITKYSLTSGIMEIDGKISEGCPTMLCPIERGSHNYFHGEEFHETREAAIAHAEEMRINKLKYLNKQMKKISALKFE